MRLLNCRLQTCKVRSRNFEDPELYGFFSGSFYLEPTNLRPDLSSAVVAVVFETKFQKFYHRISLENIH